MQSKAATVTDYLNDLSVERRQALTAVRQMILDHLDSGFVECMQYGMIGYCVPHSVYPAGYHCDPKQPLPFAGLASQKNYMSLYLCSAYYDPADESVIQDAFTKAGKKLDMGKSCIRFKKLEDLPLDAIGKIIRRITAKKYVARYEKFLSDREASRSERSAKQPSKKK